MNEEETINETIDDKTDVEISEDEDVIYETEKNPVIKIAIWFFGTIVGISVILFIIGFIMGWNGIRPPSIDSNVIQNQWDKVTSQTESPQPSSSSELDKVQRG